MGVTVCWDVDSEQPPARVAALRSMEAVAAGNKQRWLSLFDPAAVIEDPVGPSPFDEEGKGHHGAEGISAFWDLTIAHVQRFEFVVRDSHAGGDEVANVATITTFFDGGYRVDTDCVIVYRAGSDGRLLSVRAFWETDRAAATARQVDDDTSL
ncbi:MULTISPECIES: nuclear transport factor 2 family protein [Prauserella salsuginis group]|uniref:Nuclear transport factor 2 family protein n=1 Tax=Prauserella salsuginis TaxID=387889 RepID=A0ABW6G897_9PSEU|nr:MULTISPECIES: nuclear transport factor 2 family protein [Prauserella salsuginis group]MCR3721749.1 Ketosteroid isomerase-related protein [Prauserella flava]MCR3734440.1 Ketosteroid isomerase-related protein [Prauserella salsuginis]